MHEYLHKKRKMNKQQIEQLLEHSEVKLVSIKRVYEESLQKQEIDLSLLIDVKNLLENLRSCLDYVANDIAENVLILPKGSKVYFPIVEPMKDIVSYRGSVNRNLPNLENVNNKLFVLIESFQPYHADKKWLADFATITNELKHIQLIPQKRTEQVMISSQNSSTGGRVSWNPNAVQFGNGVFINGAMVNPITQMPVNSLNNTVTKEIWVDFVFDNTNISALSLLNQSVAGVKNITTQIYELLS